MYGFKAIYFLILVCALMQALPVRAAEEKCQQPEAPAILDGRSALKQQMLDMRQAIEAFFGANHAYRDCLNSKLEALSDSPNSQSLKAAIDEAITDSLEIDDLVADTFNTQLRIYKSVQE